jgi:holo-[acyl-carrier protein] synthase
MIGIDLLEPDRLGESLKRTPSLRTSTFCPGELAYSEGQAAPIEHLAARFCAKEAVVKALGIDGWDPLDIEVLDGGDRCSLALHGAVAERALDLGVAVTISLTHLAGTAGAVALALPSSLRPF